MAAREGTLFKGKIILRRASKCFYGSLYSYPKRSDHPAFSSWIIIIIRCPVERFGDRLLFLDQSHVTAAHSIQPTTIMVLLKCVITIIGAFLIDSDVDPVAFAWRTRVKREGTSLGSGRETRACLPYRQAGSGRTPRPWRPTRQIFCFRRYARMHGMWYQPRYRCGLPSSSSKYKRNISNLENIYSSRLKIHIVHFIIDEYNFTT